ncbi:MAG TPA: DUF1629 domain-containing protein [Polyangiaceae bacterium]|nr:DUF1629 domain-containing protein [Polyangiaceae bacterium]
MPVGLDGCELCHPVSQDDFERINVEVNGERRANWRPVRVQLVHEDEGRTLVASDSPWLGAHALIFRDSAVEALGGMLRDNGELLPLDCAEAALLMCNPTCVADALDEASSSVVRFSTGRIMMIQRHIFHEKVIGNIDVFKIPNLRVSPTFVSHRFVDCWRTSGLKGLEFKLVWASPNSS